MPGPSVDAALSWKRLLLSVYDQAWGLCVAYLGVGLGAELLRRFELEAGAKLQHFLDGVPIFALRLFGALDLYLSAVALGELTPFWNRLLLSAITVGTILTQATLVGGVVLLGWTAMRRLRSR